jgi:hypothetical protein
VELIDYASKGKCLRAAIIIDCYLGWWCFSQVTAVVDGFWRFLSTTNKSYGPKEDYRALLPVEAFGIHGLVNGRNSSGFGVV